MKFLIKLYKKHIGMFCIRCKPKKLLGTDMFNSIMSFVINIKVLRGKYVAFSHISMIIVLANKNLVLTQ